MAADGMLDEKRDCVDSALWIYLYRMTSKKFAPAGSSLTVWISAAVALAVSCAISIEFIDAPVARFFARHYVDLSMIAISGPMLCLLIAILIIGVGVRQLLMKRQLPLFGPFTLAGVAAIAAYALTEYILQPAFGRPGIKAFLESQHMVFGSTSGGYVFPSGHTTIAVAIAAVLWIEVPQLRTLCAIGVLLLSALLIVGQWHFVSDILAGACVGVGVAASAVSLLSFCRAKAA